MFANFPSKTKVGLVALVVVIIGFLLRRWSHNTSFTDKPKLYYDYIIVGAGTAGSLLARRLSEDPSVRVLVVEAGQDEPWISSIPFVAPAMQMTSADWGFKTTPQKHALWGFENQQANWPRGKALGGSSAINFLVHSWGSKEDYNIWKEDYGCEGWDYQTIRKYFLKQEDFRSADGRSVKDLRGTKGLLPVTEFDIMRSPVAKAFMEAGQQVGFERGDLNGELDQGIMPSQSNIKGGKRWSAYKAYLKSITDRENIDVVIDGYVTRVTTEGRKAVGIEMAKVQTGEYFYVRAGEVILSAGTVGSPHILMHSGIGDRKILEKAGVPVVAHVPGVGKNLQDHLNVPVYFNIEEPFSITISKAKSLKQLASHFLYGEGIFSWNGVEAWARTSTKPLANKTTPLGSDITLVLFNVGSVNQELFGKISNMKEEAFLLSFPETHNESKEGFIILAFCSHPHSRGEIFITSSNPFAPPHINPHYLEDPYDVNCTVKAIKLAAKIAAKEPLRSLGAKIHLPNYPECSHFQRSLHDDRYLSCWARISAMTAYHPTGTCKMGASDDPLAVVDTELRVKGIRNLRVVDASVFPRILSGPLHSAVLMVADRAADMILQSRTHDLHNTYKEVQ